MKAIACMLLCGTLLATAFAPRAENVSHANRPVVIQHPPMTRTQLGSVPERRDNGGPSPSERQQQKFAYDREKARAKQQGSNRGREDRRGSVGQSKSQPKGVVGSQDQNQQRGNGQHRD